MKKRLKIPLLCAAILAALLIVTCCPYGQCVTLRDKQGRVLYEAYWPQGETAWILFTHSVNKGLVEEGYQALPDGRVQLTGTRFREYGAGMPEPEDGQVFAARDGYFEITGYDRVFDTVWTFVGRVADHRLRMGDDGAILHLNALIEPGQSLGLSQGRWSLFKQIKWRRCCRFEPGRLEEESG